MRKSISLSLRNTVLVAGVMLFAARILQSTADLHSVQAQINHEHLYIEPGTTIIRDPGTDAHVQGKVVIDLRSGDIWGFPTDTSAPYPVDLVRKQPPTSRPIYLGKFEFPVIQNQSTPPR